jgi:hypothetical protein
MYYAPTVRQCAARIYISSHSTAIPYAGHLHRARSPGRSGDASVVIALRSAVYML